MTEIESPEENDSEIGYTLGGKTVPIDDVKAYAKKITMHRGGVKYFVKRDRHGQIFNPWGLYAQGRQFATDGTRGTAEVSFTKINQKGFEYYLKFLTTKNASWLTNAQREIING